MPIQKFNRLNKDFYQKTAPYFDTSRNFSWDGWEILAQKINLYEVKKVIDFGCGNCRFAEFLNKEMGQSSFEQTTIQYVGLDSDVYLLRKGREKLKNFASIRHSLAQTDLISLDFVLESKWEGCDLAVAFGIMHHIPTIDRRLSFLKNMACATYPNGLIVFTTWEFLDSPMLSKLVLDIDSKEGKQVLSEYGLTKSDFKPNDYILTWSRGIRAYRYAHAFTIPEIQELVRVCGLEIVDSYYSDGKDGKGNRYWICRSSKN